MDTIERSSEGLTIDVKRFYLPYVLKSHCPKCSREKAHDFEIHYLSYPTVNVPIVETLLCSNYEGDYGDPCETEWEVKIQLDVSLKIAPARSPVRVNSVKTCRDYDGRHRFHFELSDNRTVETSYKRAYWWMAGNMRRIIGDPLKSELERVCARGELNHAVETLRQIDRWVKDGCGSMILRKVPRQ